MKEKLFFGVIGGITILVNGVSIYNYYALPAIRHNEMMCKVESLDKRLERLEKESKV
jgi:hypothetical protein